MPTSSEIEAAVQRELQRKREAYGERYDDPSATTVKKWRSRAVAKIEQERFQLRLPFLKDTTCNEEVLP